MAKYYTAIRFLCAFSMIIMQVCLGSSGTLNKRKKQLLRLLYGTIVVSALCEWLGILLQGTGSSTRILHILIKAVELSAAPSIGVLIASVMDEKQIKIAVGFLAAHAVLEWLSGIFGFIYFVDAESNYSHAGCYWIYIAAYLISILYCIYAFVRAMKRYQYNGLAFFILIILFMLSGIVIQLYDSALKIDYITLAMASIILYVFTVEMIQQTDELTGMVNRRGYENYVAHLEDKSVILFFDVDKFKLVNDRYGHHFGDLCLKGVGNAVRANYAKGGKCFRIGGDEFCVILTKGLEGVEALNTQFFSSMDRLRAQEERMPYVSVGYVFFDPENDNAQDAISQADQMMYHFKQSHRDERAEKAAP